MTDHPDPKAQQDVAVQVEEPAWNGHILACCGQPCSASGWGICCLTFWLPCVTHGLNLKHLYTGQKVALGVVLFLVLCYVMPCIVFPVVFRLAFQSPDIVACEVNLILAQPDAGPVDPQFTQKLIVCQKPGWIKVWITVAFMWACALGLIVYLTIVRMRTRARLGIRAPVGLECLADFCTVWWCTTCALCQENRTLEKMCDPDTPYHMTATSPPLHPKMDV